MMTQSEDDPGAIAHPSQVGLALPCLAALLMLACTPASRPTHAGIATPPSVQDASSVPSIDAGPLLWRVNSKTGLTSYILAAQGSVSGEQLIPEVWALFDEATEIVVEQDSSQFVPWLQSREPNLSSRIGADDFTRLLIAIPAIPPDILERLPAMIVAGILVAPSGLLTPPIMQSVEGRAQAQDKKLSYLVQDQIAYQHAFAELLDDLKSLEEALSSPEASKRRDRAIRRAYLRGDAEGVAAERDSTPAMIQMVEIENEKWMPPLTEALERGGGFIVISSSDLLSPNGILKRLQERGYKVQRALPGAPASLHLPVPQFLRQEECTEVLTKMLLLNDPSLAPKIAVEAVMRSILAAEGGRQFLSLCRQQTTDWHDCAMDATTQEETEKCDVKHPLGASGGQ